MTNQSNICFKCRHLSCVTSGHVSVDGIPSLASSCGKHVRDASQRKYFCPLFKTALDKTIAARKAALEKAEFNLSNQFLYRAKTTNDGDWLYGNIFKAKDYVDEEIKHFLFPSGGAVSTADYSSFFFVVLPHTINRFTGISDKHNIKVFEHDLIVAGGKCYVVIWHKSAWQLKDIYKNAIVGLLDSFTDIEVVGNLIDGFHKDKEQNND